MNSNLIIQDGIFSRLSLTEFGYWLGVAQSDGFLKRLKKGNYYLGLGVRKKSMPMFLRFCELSRRITDNCGSIYIDTRKNKEAHQFLVGCNKLIPSIKRFELVINESKPPSFVRNNERLFGAYLAGLIDGDGDVRVTRPEYPQCSVRISLNRKIEELILAIKNNLKCGVNYQKTTCTKEIEGRKITSTSRRIEFKISRKNWDYVSEKVLGFIQLEYKKNKIQKFIEMKGR